MTPNQITEAAEKLAEAWVENKTIDLLSGELRPQDRKTAVAIQDELAKKIGHKVVGWKVGGELVGRVFQPNLIKSPALLSEKVYGRALLEVELAFRILSDLIPRSSDFSPEEVAEHAVLVPTFELVGTRFSGERLNPQVEKEFLLGYADNGFQIGVVFGDDISDWRNMSLLDIPIELSVDGGPPVPGVPRENRREPLEVLVWLANDLSRRGISLEAGQVATVGAAVGPAPMGKKAIATFGEIASIELTVTNM